MRNTLEATPDGSPKTVWEFRSIDGHAMRALRPAHIDDARYQHEYQRIVYRGVDREKIKAALEK